MSKRLASATTFAVTITTSLLLYHGEPFRILVIFAFWCATMEIKGSYGYPMSHTKPASAHTVTQTSVYLLAMVYFGLIATYRANIIVMIGVAATDVSAYIYGKIFGGTIIRARPFPRTSPRKSWEGIIAGLLMSFNFVLITIYILDGGTLKRMAPSDYVFFACGITSIIGDYLGSKFKRFYGVKDSCEFIYREDKIMTFAEKLLGGAKGQGGYIDRFGSLAFTGAVLFFTSFITPF